jgi:putative membrane protein
MKTTLLPQTLRRTRGLLCLALAAVVGSAEAAATTGRIRTAAARSFRSHFAVTPMASDGLRESEQTFLESASERCRRELRLAQVALTQASTSDLRALALQMSGDQARLRDAIEALMRKNGIGVPTGENQPPEEYQRLLEMSGSAFDREAVALLSRIHEELMTLFEQAASEARDPDVRALAASELPMIRDHRQQLIQLKKVYE